MVTLRVTYGKKNIMWKQKKKKKKKKKNNNNIANVVCGY